MSDEPNPRILHPVTYSDERGPIMMNVDLDLRVKLTSPSAAAEDPAVSPAVVSYDANGTQTPEPQSDNADDDNDGNSVLDAPTPEVIATLKGIITDAGATTKEEEPPAAPPPSVGKA